MARSLVVFALILLAVIASAGAPAATRAGCVLSGVRWKHTENGVTLVSKGYNITVARVTCGFAQSWVRRLIPRRGVKPQEVIKNGPAGYPCYNLGPQKGPNNIDGGVIVGRCWNGPVGKGFGWAPIGYP